MISALHLGLNKRVLKVPIAPTEPPTPTNALLNALVSSRSHCKTCCTVPYSRSACNSSLSGRGYCPDRRPLMSRCDPLQLL